MNAPGLCMCGCGAPTIVSTHTDRSKGWAEGKPRKYLKGHSLIVHARLKTQRAIGNREMTSHGYVRVRVGNGQRPYEHILVAERSLGRPLRHHGQGHPDTEVVHHIDGNKTNNAPSNLLICTHRYHTELHHRLEQSPAWPEFPPIVRFTGAARA